jgi:hypothetical protein
MEETSSRPGSSGLHPKKRAVQPVRKRAALANISNQQNVAPSGRPVAGLPDVKPVVLKPTLIAHGDENARPGDHGQPCGNSRPLEAVLDPQPEPITRTSAEAIASLERRTVQNLYISQEAKDRLKQGTTDRAILYRRYAHCSVFFKVQHSLRARPYLTMISN